MAKRGTTRAMSDKHETYLVEVLGGRANRGSGNQAANPMDGRHDRREASVAFAWDAKSTYYRSIGISREMWDKAAEQAYGERPMIPLRFYDTDRLDVGLDLAAIRLDDLAELLERSARLDEIALVLDSHYEFTDYEEDQPGTAFVAALRKIVRGT